MTLPIGELFLLGFRSPQIPAWLRDFAHDFGLGGVILFDYDCIDKKYERNIFDPAQVRALCADLHALPGGPLIFIDQEGGKVRRLKEERGFAPLPSARMLGRMSVAERLAVLRPAYRELRELGIDVNLAPVVDLDINPDSPDIGSAQRSFSADPAIVEECAATLAEVARSVALKLCLKHFPGTGGARVNPHDHVMDLSDCLTEPQVAVFERLIDRIPMVLFSHGVVSQWEKDTPVCLSSVAVGKLRAVAPQATILTDDLQMQGVQKLMSTGEACSRALRAGADFLLIGNNMLDEQAQAAGYAHELCEACETDALMRIHAEESIDRIRGLKP
ncbi:glycoside hydrolase family 3 N-terminal domain-containing protein [Methylosinus sp. Sm6]|uniref:glycoside hydrolase family 3 N-terminal domain-containing protein n=1 Tax=Methylosinus sp. Sm6 TaxID=2866948 RepID=UPI001C9A0EC0|nr:glycoside hydrolase family 3 N-terminal domain-containing protein [Methylosinus sp. Sm6]MBY6241695.1 glycoside hydrolase family 3 protein [Methylosinus sp. Sm6]